MDQPRLRTQYCFSNSNGEKPNVKSSTPNAVTPATVNPRIRKRDVPTGSRPALRNGQNRKNRGKRTMLAKAISPMTVPAGPGMEEAMIFAPTKRHSAPTETYQFLSTNIRCRAEGL